MFTPISLDFEIGILVMAAATAVYLWSLYRGGRIIKWEEAPASTQHTIKEHEKKINRYLNMGIGLGIVGFWTIVALFLLNPGSWQDSSHTEPLANPRSFYDNNPLIAYVYILAAPALFLWSLFLMRYWRRSEQKVKKNPIVRLPSFLVWLCVGAGAIVLAISPFIVRDFFAMRVGMGALIVTFAILALPMFCVIIFSRWKISILEDSFLLRPMIGRAKEFPFTKIDRVVVSPALSYKIYFNEKRVTTVQPQYEHSLLLLKRLEEEGIRIERKALEDYGGNA